MSRLRKVACNRRRLRLESLEARRVLAAIVTLSDSRFGVGPVDHAFEDVRLGQPLDSVNGEVADARTNQSSPLYFNSIEQVESNRFHIVDPILPLEESDFLIQRARQFRLSSELLDPVAIEADDILILDLFSDAAYRSVVQSKTTNVNNTTTLVVKLQEYDFAFGYISITGADYLVSVDIPEERAYFETRHHPQSGSVFLVQLDSNRPDVLDSSAEPLQADEFTNSGRLTESRQHTDDFGMTGEEWDTSGSDLEGILIDQPEATIEKGGRAVNSTAGYPKAMNGALGGAGNQQAQIDVMVVYTPAANSWSSNINNTIATAMARSNTASNNSNLGITFNLAYSGLVNYTESGSGTDLGRLRDPFDGFLDEVHAIRNTHAADMVAILTFTNDTGGIAYLNDSRYGREDLAFSLTRVQQASSTDTFVHELGHNMGVMHSKFQNVQSGPTFWSDWPENNWSAGWRFQGNNGSYYTTVMAYSGGQFYPDGNNATRIPYFSDPNIVFQGQPAGHAVDGDNARSLREVRNYVSHYRDADTLLYCSANGGFSGLGITNVQLGSIDQVASYYPFYDFSFASTDIDVATTQQLTVSVTTPSTLNQVRVWVDWNDDKDFFDAGELISISSSASVTQYVIPVTPPPGTSSGQKRMRIRLHQPNLGGNLSPCGGSSSGKVLDFKLNVVAPSSTIVDSSVFHSAWTGSVGNALDSLKVLAKEGPASQTLGFEHLINTAQGINGLQFDIDGLPGALSASDFVFQWSPQGAYVEGLNPPTSWQDAPAPTSIGTTVGNPSQVLIQWADGTIMNRWLRVTVLGNTNTGLSESEVYYVGHLLGETTGPSDGIFTVSFADINEIRGAVGQTVNSSSISDVDKSGVVAFSDINAMRQNIGGQLPAITISATGGGGAAFAAPGGSGFHPFLGGLMVNEEKKLGYEQPSLYKPSSGQVSSLILMSSPGTTKIASIGEQSHVEQYVSSRSVRAMHRSSVQASLQDEALQQLSEEVAVLSTL